jgi:hypothetical protein
MQQSGRGQPQHLIVQPVEHHGQGDQQHHAEAIEPVRV